MNMEPFDPETIIHVLSRCEACQMGQVSGACKTHENIGDKRLNASLRLATDMEACDAAICHEYEVFGPGYYHPT